MNKSEYKKCAICSNRNCREFSLNVLELYILGNQSKFLQKYIPHAPKKLQQEINSHCQELDSWDKKVEPYRKELIVLWEKLLREKTDKSLLMAFDDDFKKKNEDSMRVLEREINLLIGKFNEGKVSEEEKNRKAREMEDELIELSHWGRGSFSACEVCCGQELVEASEKLNEWFENNQERTSKIVEKSNQIFEQIYNELEKEKSSQIERECEKEVMQETAANVEKTIKGYSDKASISPKNSSVDSESNTSSNSNKNNTIYWVLGSIAGAGMIGGIAYWLIKRNKKKE